MYDDAYTIHLSRDCLIGSLEFLKEFEHNGKDSEAHAERMSTKYREEFFNNLIQTIPEDDQEALKIVEFLATFERLFNLTNRIMSTKLYDEILAVLEKYNWRDTLKVGSEMLYPIRCLNSLRSGLQIQRENSYLTPDVMSTAFSQAEKQFISSQYFPSLEQCKEWMEDAARGETDPVTIVVPGSSHEITLQFSALPSGFHYNWFK